MLLFHQLWRLWKSFFCRCHILRWIWMNWKIFHQPWFALLRCQEKIHWFPTGVTSVGIRKHRGKWGKCPGFNQASKKHNKKVTEEKPLKCLELTPCNHWTKTRHNLVICLESMLKTSYVMWVCNFWVLKHQPQNLRLLQEAFRIRQVHSVFCRFFRLFWYVLLYLNMWVALVRKKHRAMFWSLVTFWKNHTERVHLFDSLGFTIYLDEVCKLQTFPQVETNISGQSASCQNLNPIKAAKNKWLGHGRSGSKKRFCWSSPHGTSRRHEPIEWGMLNHHHHHHPQIWPNSPSASCSKLQHRQVILKIHDNSKATTRQCRSPFVFPQFCGWFCVPDPGHPTDCLQVLWPNDLAVSGENKSSFERTAKSQRTICNFNKVWASGISVFHSLLRYCLSGRLRYPFLEFTISVSMPGMRVIWKCKASCRNLSHLFFTFELGFNFWNFKFCPT